MGTTQVTMRGRVKPDGSLELEAPVSLASGPVEVTIQSVCAPDAVSGRKRLIDVLDEIHAAQKARGQTDLTTEVMEADEARRRAEDEEYEKRWRTIWSQTTTRPPPEGSA
jgi:hypothetical protein